MAGPSRFSTEPAVSAVEGWGGRTIAPHEDTTWRLAKMNLAIDRLTTQKYLEPSKETEEQLESMKLPF
jgi:hypothetical protein